MTRIKICGLKTLEDIEAVNDFLPDYAGFVFAKSSRRISYTQAEVLKYRLSKRIKAVGVFVNAPLKEAALAANRGLIDLIQLHGEEDREYIEALRQMTDKPFIKAVRVRSGEDVLLAQSLPCDYLLLDAYTKGVYGGSGKPFAWELIPKIKKPFFLAGGLNTDNIEEAIETVKPFGVDVSSFVETEGKKDREKIRQFIERVREQRGR